MILALDTATTTGWAVGETGTTPVWGSINFGGRGRTNGEIVALFRRWLVKLIVYRQPRLIVFESPYVPRNGSAVILRRLMALAGEVEATGWDHSVEVREARPQDIEKFILGQHHRRAAKKAATIAAVARYGFDVDGDDDSADALALWLMAEAQIAPALAARRGIGPLFIPARAGTETAPDLAGPRGGKPHPAPKSPEISLSSW